MARNSMLSATVSTRRVRWSDFTLRAHLVHACLYQSSCYTYMQDFTYLSTLLPAFNDSTCKLPYVSTIPCLRLVPHRKALGILAAFFLPSMMGSKNFGLGFLGTRRGLGFNDPTLWLIIQQAICVAFCRERIPVLGSRPTWHVWLPEPRHTGKKQFFKSSLFL